MTAASVPAQRLDTPFRELLAAEVRAHLARQRLSNRQFAKLLSVQPTWIDRRLNGTTPIDANDIELFSDALGLTPQQLISGAFSPDINVPTRVGNRRYPADIAPPLRLVRNASAAPTMDPDLHRSTVTPLVAA